MCGRFFVVGEGEDVLLSRMMEEASRRQQTLTGETTIAAGEISPSQVTAALALGKSGVPSAYPMQWGFHRPDGKGLIINTRSETALEKPMFRASMETRRCLIPCNWYFEWELREGQQSMLDDLPSLQTAGDPLPKKRTARQGFRIKYAIRPKTDGLIYLAGIYRYEEAYRLPLFSVLTRAPAPEIAFIHDRMPVIFSEANHLLWLDRSVQPSESLALCEQEMIYRQVS